MTLEKRARNAVFNLCLADKAGDETEEDNATSVQSQSEWSKAKTHKACASDAQSDFLSDETKNAVNTLCIHEAFCEI